MKRKYDVIIIGAGPAGLRCAEGLKDSNLSVLLIEKNKVIGPKICGGGLSPLAVGLDIPDGMTRSFEKQNLFLKDKLYEIKTSIPLRTIDRYDLGQYMLSKLKGSNKITVLKGTHVKSIRGKYVVTDKGTFYFRYLVGADGSHSLVRKHLGLKNKILIGIRYIIPKTHDKMVWIFNPKLLYSGYAWVFPHKDFTSAGVVFSPQLLSPAKAKEALDKILDDYGLDYNNARLEAAQINCLFKGVEFGDVFLVGDAAGLACLNTGEGIPFALTSGEEVAKKILNPRHKMIKLDRILKIKKRREFILAAFDTFPSLQTLLFTIFLRLMKTKLFQSYYSG